MLDTMLFSFLLPKPADMRKSTLDKDHMLAAQVEAMQEALKTMGSNSGDSKRVERVAQNSYDYASALVNKSAANPEARRRSLGALAKKYTGNGYLSLALQKAASDVSGVQNGHATMAAGGDAHDAFVHGGATGLDFVISYIEETSNYMNISS